MSTQFGFCDLCVEADWSNKKFLLTILRKLCEMGYTTIAINQNLDESVLETEKKGKKKSATNLSAVLPDPPDLNDITAEFSGKLRILSRLTFSYSEATKTHTLNQFPNLKKYDLYAVMPKTQAALQFACSQLNVDIVTVNKNCTGLKLNRKLYQQATERGAHFELHYADVINRNTRKFTVHYSHLFHMFGKSKNVILTSGASEPCQIRSPYDVINLASILGLNETKAKASVLTQCRYLILKAEGRRYGKSVFEICTNIDVTSPMEMESDNNDDESKPT